jgi:hypothetical protein
MLDLSKVSNEMRLLLLQGLSGTEGKTHPVAFSPEICRGYSLSTKEEGLGDSLTQR